MDIQVQYIYMSDVYTYMLKTVQICLYQTIRCLLNNQIDSVNEKLIF